MNHRINEAAMLEREQFERTMHDQLINYTASVEAQLNEVDRATQDLDTAWENMLRVTRDCRCEVRTCECSKFRENYSRCRTAQHTALCVLEHRARSLAGVVRQLDGLGLIRGGKA